MSGGLSAIEILMNAEHNLKTLGEGTALSRHPLFKIAMEQLASAIQMMDEEEIEDE